MIFIIETYAILDTLKLACTDNLYNIAIYADSMSVIKKLTIRSNKNHKITNNIQEIYMEFSKIT